MGSGEGRQGPGHGIWGHLTEYDSGELGCILKHPCNNNNTNLQAATAAEKARAAHSKSLLWVNCLPRPPEPSFHFTVTRAEEGAFGSSSGSFREDIQFYVCPPNLRPCYAPPRSTKRSWGGGAQEQLGLKRDPGQAKGPGGRNADLNVQVRLLPRPQPLRHTQAIRGKEQALGD